MPQPLVSIVIPVFNGEANIGTTIESALAQDWDPIEVIVVDDGSSDASLRRVRAYEQAGVRVIAQANRGGSAARNTGFRSSQGAYIQFLDHDDLLAPDKIRRQVLRAQGSPRCPVAGLWTRFANTTAGSYGGWCPPEPFQRDCEPLEWLIGSPMVPTCAWLTPRPLVEDAGLWNEALVGNPDDDGEFFMRVIACSNAVLFSAESRSYFRAESGASAGHSETDDALRSVFEVCRTFERIVLGMTDSAAAKQSCAHRYLAFMHRACPRVPELVAEAERRVTALGFDPGSVPDTPRYEWLSRVVGWRAARRLQKAWQRVRQAGSRRRPSRY